MNYCFSGNHRDFCLMQNSEVGLVAVFSENIRFIDRVTFRNGSKSTRNFRRKFTFADEFTKFIEAHTV